MKSYMEEEIFEQGKVIGSIIKEYTSKDEVTADFPTNYKKIKFIASGSSFNCAKIAEKFFRDYTDADTTSEFASEFMAQKEPKISSDTLYIVISQSGKTVDTLGAMKKIQECGAKVFAIVNDPDSPMYREADHKMCAMAGEEKSIAATKSLSACIACIWLCAVKMSNNQKAYLDEIKTIEADIESVLNASSQIDEAAKFLATIKCFPIVGYDYYYAISGEAALKIKETSYSDSNAYALGEFIHGHVALLNSRSGIVEIFMHDLGAFERKNLGKIVNEYHPKRVTITDFEDELCGEYKIIIPQFKSKLTQSVAILINIQLLALKIATELKMDIDNPNGLSKIVV